jgi:hypothetical protein
MLHVSFEQCFQKWKLLRKMCPAEQGDSFEGDKLSRESHYVQSNFEERLEHTSHD